MMKLFYSLLLLPLLSYPAFSQHSAAPETQRCYYAFGPSPGTLPESSLLKEIDALPAVLESKIRQKEGTGQAELIIRFSARASKGEESGFSPASVKRLLIQYDLVPGDFVIRED
ncbi:MAG: hypothetical protein IBJ09_08955 [Bacteroidia bacterium]|nr:hypothetical protein [Bacteroidia bacterium]